MFRGEFQFGVMNFFNLIFYFYFMFEVIGQVKGSIIYMRDEELLTVLIVTQPDLQLEVTWQIDEEGD